MGSMSHSTGWYFHRIIKADLSTHHHHALSKKEKKKEKNSTTSPAAVQWEPEAGITHNERAAKKLQSCL